MSPPLTLTGRRLITTFGLGYLRPAPGTWGSLPPCIIAAALLFVGNPLHIPSGGIPWYALFALIALFFSWVCIHYGPGAEATFGKKDPSHVVADETAGMAVTLAFIPWPWLIIPADTERNSILLSQLAGLIAIAAAFILFRIFDILKLPPAHGLQRLTGGWGILIDDLIAGVQAGVTLLLLAWAWKQL